LRYFRYRPAKRCVFLWAFNEHRSRPLLVSGALFHGSDGARIVASASFQRQAEQATALIGGLSSYSYLPRQRLLLQLFPLDCELPGLLRGTSEHCLRDEFAKALGGAPAAIRIVGVRPVRLKPWQRCALTYEVAAGSRKHVYFAKALPGRLAADLLPRLRALRERLRKEAAPWEVPEPVCCLEGAGVLVLEQVHGIAAKSLLQQASEDAGARRDLRRLVRMAAEGLASFQRAVVPGLATLTPQVLLRDLADDIDGLGKAVPDLALSMRRVLRRLERQSTRLPSEALVLGHASFRHSHFVLRNRKPVILDLDGVCLCGPNADAGNFLAYLQRAALRRPRRQAIYQECGGVFLAGVKRLPGFSPEWLAWHRAAAQLKGALRSFSSLSSRWIETTQGLVRLAEQELGPPKQVRRALARLD
jgi:hypothetical protein